MEWTVPLLEKFTCKSQSSEAMGTIKFSKGNFGIWTDRAPEISQGSSTDCFRPFQNIRSIIFKDKDMNNEDLIKLFRRTQNLPSFTAGFCSEINSSLKSCPNELMLLVAALCLSMEEGDVCIRLCDDETLSLTELSSNKLRADILSKLFTRISDNYDSQNKSYADLAVADQGLYQAFKAIFLDDAEALKKIHKNLIKSLKTSAVGTGDSEIRTPLVYDIGRLYLRRYYDYECKVAGFINDRKGQSLVDDESSMNLARECLNELFGRSSLKTACSIKQKCAAALALLSPFTVISGGPGTGKTTTVTKLLLTLLCLLRARGEIAPRIKLCAPTGKAAGRLGQSLEEQLSSDEAYAEDDGQISIVDFIKKHSQDGESIGELIPRRATTVHSLIGVHPHSKLCNFNKSNPLPCDILVVDEVSMIDLMLFTKLIDALSPNTILILLGDKDQLCSVEAGSVMADLCAQKNHGNSLIDTAVLQKVADLTGSGTDLLQKPGEMTDNVMFLTHSFRFDKDSGIGNLAALVRDGSLKNNINSGKTDRKEVFLADLADVKKRFEGQQLAFHAYSSEDKGKVMRSLVHDAVDGDNNSYKEFVNFIKSRASMTAEDAKDALSLLNKFRILCSNRNGIFGTRRLNTEIKTSLMKDLGSQSGEWFTGRVVMATQNSQSGGVHNGDVGFVFVQNGEPKVWFEDEKGGARAVSTVYLTNCEDAYAMTVHKSQGSEYDRVIMAISDKDNAVLSRELIYTGITRAKHLIEVYCNDEIFSMASLRSVERQSGLASRLAH